MNRGSDFNNDNSLIDQDNRARAERLALKLARLKNVAVDIEEETRDHIPMLDEVDGSYERTLAALKSGQNKLTGLIRSNRRGKRLFCYTVLIIMIFMIIIYVWFNSS